MNLTEHECFNLHNADYLTMPVLVSIPHAGRFYPSALFDNLRLPPDALVRLEDRYADLLARDAVAAGATAIAANVARAWIDLNRDEQDLDAEMIDGLDRSNRPAPGVKQRGGLGLIPRRLSGLGDLWRNRISAGDVAQRIDTFHRPYHSQVSAILAQMHRLFGTAILLDLHSMPPVPVAAHETPPDFVIGDQFGRSASSRYSEFLVDQIRARGFNVNLNNPYAGDHMLRLHGNVRGGIHAIQLEVDRTLYLQPGLREPNSSLPQIAQFIANLVQGLANEAMGGTQLLAAE